MFFNKFAKKLKADIFIFYFKFYFNIFRKCLKDETVVIEAESKECAVIKNVTYQPSKTCIFKQKKRKALMDEDRKLAKFPKIEDTQKIPQVFFTFIF